MQNIMNSINQLAFTIF